MSAGPGPRPAPLVWVPDSLCGVFSLPLPGVGELVLGSPVGTGRAHGLRSLWDLNLAPVLCSYVTHLSKAGSSAGNGSHDAWAAEGPGEGWMRWELRRVPTRPSPEDAQVGRCHHVILPFEPLPGLQALWLQWGHSLNPPGGATQSPATAPGQRVQRLQNGPSRILTGFIGPLRMRYTDNTGTPTLFTNQRKQTV